MFATSNRQESPQLTLPSLLFDLWLEQLMQSLFRRSNRMHVASYARGVQSKASPILARNGLNNSVIPARLLVQATHMSSAH